MSLVNNLSSFFSENIKLEDVFAAKRELYYDKFMQCGLPSRKHDRWQGANIAKLAAESLILPAVATGATSSLVSNSQSWPLLDGADIIVYNGQLILNNLPEGVVASSFAGADHAQLELILRFFTDCADYEFTNQFAYYVLAAWYDGLLLDITAACKLRVVYLQTETCFLNWCSFINIADSATVQLTEVFYGVGDYWQNNFTSVALAAGAKLVHEKIQQHSCKAKAQYIKHVALESKSEYGFAQYNFGGGFVCDDVVVALNGQESSANLRALDFVLPNLWHSLNILVRHNASRCLSKQLVKSIIADGGESCFLGHILVPQHITATEAYQDSKAILLGKNAHAKAKPYLEIYAEDVICTHSAAVGKLAAESLFYMLARGLSMAEAQFLLLQAFAAAITTLCVDKLLSKELEHLLEKLSSNVCEGNSFTELS